MVERDAPVVDARNARGVPPPVPPRIFVQLENAYLRRRTVEESRVVELLTVREDMPYIETIELPWGAKLIPDDELERLAAERRRTARPRLEPATRGRKPALPPEIAKRIHHERSAGKSLRQIAANLNADRIPTAHGGENWWPSTVRAILRRAA